MQKPSMRILLFRTQFEICAFVVSFFRAVNYGQYFENYECIFKGASKQYLKRKKKLCHGTRNIKLIYSV